ncbi:MAG: outer membrane beta-barrel protein [Candidatus Paracaedibacteraceae bacterium]|nr:outer membrane beta-barrel protein [Candidatus Paracaedibacteraceae bacterium]
MKKIIASAVVAAATLSASQAAVFNGYSVGITGGSFTSHNKLKATGAKGKLDKTFGTYGIHFDYDRSAPNAFYWGLGLDVMVFSGKKSQTGTVPVRGVVGVRALDGNLSSTLKLRYRWSSELDARFGYNICNNAAVYGLVGARAYNKIFTVNTSFNGTVNGAATNASNSDKVKKTRIAPVVGAGIKAKIAANLSAGLEYRYAFEREEKYTGFETKAKFKQDAHAVLAKVSYHF